MLANLLAAPLVPVATVAGVAAALASVVVPRRPRRLGGVVPTAGIAQVARMFAQVPGRHPALARRRPGALLLAMLTLVVLFTGERPRRRRRGAPLLALGSGAS